MYMDYAKLWKLLIDKNMSRSDLIALTGISSRVMAKLSKNETVTTDTLARICAALACDVGDIMECVSEKQLSLYALYRQSGECAEKNELFRTIRFSAHGQNYVVYASARSAVKESLIHCREDGAVYWEQVYPIGHLTNGRDTVRFVKPLRDPNVTEIVLIRGKPGIITGLDENGFISARGTRKKDTDIYVMSEAAFKLFAPQEHL